MIRIILLSTLVCIVLGHGRLRDPPSRSSAWREGFNTPANYNDNELFCGGFTNQWLRNGGKCGICGDPWQNPTPRANELGGKYGKGVITRTYKKGQVISTTIELTTTHKGWYELRLCPLAAGTDKTDATQECFDKHILQQADGSSGRIKVTAQKIYKVDMKLPNDVVCEHCVIQWHYNAGNNWGKCENGGHATGCGPQETFRGCADVKIEL
uniref:Chitin-binding type-4 domain-containing protein n=1 Tax=Strigamia maritima TaxID=126957 RepID=T1JDM2_STRMM